METGVSLMEIDCHSMEMVMISMRFVLIKEFTYVVVPRQLVSIAAILQLLLSMMKLTSQ